MWYEGCIKGWNLIVINIFSTLDRRLLENHRLNIDKMLLLSRQPNEINHPINYDKSMAYVCWVGLVFSKKSSVFKSSVYVRSNEVVCNMH